LKKLFRRNRKGMSIVISTVIIVAISITMAIAVAFWAMGIGNSLTKFEKLEFRSAYSENYQYQTFSTPGSGATAAVTLDGNGGVNIALVSGGGGYIRPPRVVVSGGGGAGVVATTSITNGVVTRISVTNHGYGFTSLPAVQIVPVLTVGYYFPVYLQIKNTGSASAVITNLFLDGKPYDAVSVNAPQPLNLFTQVTVGFTLGSTSDPNGRCVVNLPYSASPSTQTQYYWNSGDYVEIELETAAGRMYSTTVVLP
jgi:hypothetical protein